MEYEQLAEEFLKIWAQIIRNPFHKESETTSRGELGVLGYLAFVKDGVSPGELREKFGVGSGRIADTLKSLSQKDLIERREDGSDKRKALVFLTETGRKTALAKRKAVQQTHVKLMKFLGEKDSEELIRIVKRILLFQEHTVQ